MAIRCILASALIAGECSGYCTVAPICGRQRRNSYFQLKRVRSWRDTLIPSSQLSASNNFYDDFEDFSNEFDESPSPSDNDKEKTGDEDNIPKSYSDNSSDDAVMKSLRDRMNDLSKQTDADDLIDKDDDGDSGSSLPDLEGSTISSIDELIGFAQAKARAKAKDSDSKSDTLVGTWEAENWARPIPHTDEKGNLFNLEKLLEGGIVLVANPAKFCADLADGEDAPKSKKGILEGFFDDPFPSSPKLDTGGISPALLAKFGITLPPSPDLGPDRRADLLPVVLLIDRDAVQGCQAVLMNRRTGNLMGDLPPSLFQSSDGEDEANTSGFSPHPLAAFMIQPLWWAGSSPSSNGDDLASRGRGVKAIDMVHACPYLNGSVPLEKSDGLYWGGDPVEAQNVMSDSRLEKPLNGFDFKFFIQSTRFTQSQLEEEIKDGVWYLAEVSKEVLFRSRDRLGSKRAKPLWTEIIELMGYTDVRDQLYKEEEGG